MTLLSGPMAVLLDRALLMHITQFQGGVPLLFHELHVWSQQPTDRTMRPRRGANKLLFSALVRGDLGAVQLLWRMRRRPEYAHLEEIPSVDLLRDATEWGRVDVLQWLHTSNEITAPWPPTLMADAAAARRAETAQWLLQHRPETCAQRITAAMSSAAGWGHLQLLQELIRIHPTALMASVMDAAIKKRQWATMSYLHEHSPTGCSTRGMDLAAAKGFVDVVSFLHTHRTEGCTTEAMDSAAANGHLAMVTFLHEHRTEGCTTHAMNTAAAKGHIEVVQFLHKNRHDGCTAKAMDAAAANGDLAMVEFLYANRTERCTREALAKAAVNGHTATVKFLYGTCGVRPPRHLQVRQVYKHYNMELVKYLHEDIALPFDIMYISSRMMANARGTRSEGLLTYIAHCQAIEKR